MAPRPGTGTEEIFRPAKTVSLRALLGNNAVLFSIAARLRAAQSKSALLFACYTKVAR